MENVPKKPKNPLAFPRPISTDAFPADHAQMGNYVESSNAQDGMTLRDYFAAKAMHAHLVALANSEMTKPSGMKGDALAELIAESAYQQADFMLKAREEE